MTPFSLQNCNALQNKNRPDNEVGFYFINQTLYVSRISSLNPRIRKEIADGFIIVDAADGFGENRGN